MDSLHDRAHDIGSDYTTVLHDFQNRGCVAMGWAHSDHGDNADVHFRASAMDAMFDLLGDDVDGAAAMMEDWGF